MCSKNTRAKSEFINKTCAKCRFINNTLFIICYMLNFTFINNIYAKYVMCVFS